MAKIMSRQSDRNRSKTPNFTFHTRKLQGIPERDSVAEQESKAKAIDQFKRTKGITKCPAVSRGSVGG